jgi:hypothetical protein
MHILALLTLATIIPVSEFRSIALSNGGHVVVRHGPVQSVSIRAGDLQYTRVRVDDQRLIIDRTARECPERYRLEIEVVTPHVSRVSVSNGGTVQTIGEFPAQASIEADVEQGGTADIRAIPADRVNASVYSGGRIFTTAQQKLTASVESGGAITYWGDVQDVSESVRHGGVVTRGNRPE